MFGDEETTKAVGGKLESSRTEVSIYGLKIYTTRSWCYSKYKGRMSSFADLANLSFMSLAPMWH
jgi:hypothetical protein